MPGGESEILPMNQTDRAQQQSVAMARRRVLSATGVALAAGALPLMWPMMSRADQADDVNPADKSTYYTVQHPQEFDLDYANALYRRADSQTADALKNLPHHLNLPFGAHPKQRLDLYLPKGTISNAPVLMFVHGGGFEEGDRKHYGFVASSYAARGIIVVVAGYRLAADGARYPAPPNDVRDAFVWLHENLSRYHGNSNSIFLSGHSVGAIMVGDLGADRTWLTTRGIPPSVLRGIALVSGCYELIRNDDFDPVNGETISAEYVPTVDLQIRASALMHLNDPPRAAVIAFGDGDPYERRFVRSSRKLQAALASRHVDSNLVYLKGQTHIDTVFSFADAQSTLFKAVLSMIGKWA